MKPKKSSVKFIMFILNSIFLIVSVFGLVIFWKVQTRYEESSMKSNPLVVTDELVAKYQYEANEESLRALLKGHSKLQSAVVVVSRNGIKVCFFLTLVFLTNVICVVILYKRQIKSET